MNNDKLMKIVYEFITNNADLDYDLYSKLSDTYMSYDEYCKCRVNRENLSNIIYYSRNINDLSKWLFENPYSFMNEEIKDFIYKLCELVKNYNKDCF
ncbi:MAG: hypothetical protein [Caudoviricetes sp.]|nr:MAG: hypothetical protein [Caudoviricetes sp.]